MILLSRLKTCFYLNHKLLQRQFNNHAYNKFHFNLKSKKETVTSRKFSSFYSSILSKLKVKKSTIRFISTDGTVKKTAKISQADIRRLLKLAKPEKWKLLGIFYFQKI